MFGKTNTKRISASGNAPRNSNLLGITSLVGNRIYTNEGKSLGKLEEIVIDTRTGCVRHAVLAVGGFLGIGQRRLAVPWSTLTPDMDYRRCVVNVTQMQLMAVQVPDDDPWLQRNSPAQSGERNARGAHALGARLAW